MLTAMGTAIEFTLPIKVKATTPCKMLYESRIVTKNHKNPK
jgi:hypothetical protein